MKKLLLILFFGSILSSVKAQDGTIIVGWTDPTLASQVNVVVVAQDGSLLVGLSASPYLLRLDADGTSYSGGVGRQ